MNSESLTIKPCNIHELPLALSILDDAARWLNERGIHQWQAPLPDDFRQFMQDETQAGRVYLAKMGEGAETVATFRITHSDVPRWRDDGRDNALYLYTLAIKNDLHGQHTGARVIGSVAVMAAGLGKTWLRLDVWTPNTTLQRYYASLGFEHAGEVDDDGFPLTLYQRRSVQRKG